jgi:hypothetical protein
LTDVAEQAVTASPSGQGGTLSEVEIVGESFYVEAFRLLRTQLSMASGDESQVQVTLANEEGNPHAKEGKAVAVYVLSHKVGYVASWTAQFVFDELASSGGSRTFLGKIHFGDLRESPPKNSVSITYSVQTKTPTETKKAVNRQLSEERKREDGELLKKDFLRNPQWSDHTLVSGDDVVFSGFSQFVELPKLVDYLLPAAPKTGISLLVLHPRQIADSAKLCDWLIRGKPATDLGTFLKFNPDFAKYFNAASGEFDMPTAVTGSKRKVSEPPLPTIAFEYDSYRGATKVMSSDIVLLPQQTLSTFPSFTVYGRFNWRLSDLKNYQSEILALFDEVQGKVTDGIVLRGVLREIDQDGQVRIAYQFRGRTIALVPLNETARMAREGNSWRSANTLAVVNLDFKGNLKGEHDCGLTEKYNL